MKVRSSKSPPFISTFRVKLLIVLNRKLETGEFSDATILADGRTWRVHRMLLSTRSRWFAEAFEKQSSGEDEGEPEINLRELKTEFVDMLLRTLYCNREFLPDKPREMCGV